MAAHLCHLTLICSISDYLRCTHINIAATSNGGQCTEASHDQGTCGLVIDGGTANGWASNGGIGQWIKIQFVRAYLLNTIRVMQRVELTDLAKSLRLEFSDSSEAYVSRSGEDYFIFSLDLGGTTYKFIHQRMGERISGFFPSFSSEHSILKMLKHNSLR